MLGNLSRASLFHFFCFMLSSLFLRSWSPRLWLIRLEIIMFLRSLRLIFGSGLRVMLWQAPVSKLLDSSSFEIELQYEFLCAFNSFLNGFTGLIKMFPYVLRWVPFLLFPAFQCILGDIKLDDCVWISLSLLLFQTLRSIFHLR